jgi:two-component system, OmpR family, response regulator
MSGNSILLVEDDRDIGTLLADFLVREAFAVEVAQDGAAVDRIRSRQARPRDPRPHAAGRRRPVDLPAFAGPQRGAHHHAHGQERRRRPHRRAGTRADDYLGKPFNPRELLARIRAILRRTERSGSAPPARRLRSFAGFVADLDARSVDTRAGARVPLTAAEFDLLACFVERPRRVLTRDQLLDWTRGRSADPFDRTIDVTVSRLRKKLELADPAAAAIVATVRNGGYLFSAEVAEL